MPVIAELGMSWRERAVFLAVVQRLHELRLGDRVIVAAHPDFAVLARCQRSHAQRGGILCAPLVTRPSVRYGAAAAWRVNAPLSAGGALRMERASLSANNPSTMGEELKRLQERS